MLSQYNPIDIEAALRRPEEGLVLRRPEEGPALRRPEEGLALRNTSPQPPFAPGTDRAAWAALRQTIGEARAAEIIQAAEKAALTPVPALPATVWLEFLRVGQREGYQTPRTLRHTLLSDLVLGECLEGSGRFLDPILNLVWAICEESSWVLPAHQSVLTTMTHPVIDLGSAMTSLMLAEVDLLVGPLLDPLVGERIRYEVDRRSFTPYLTRHDFWWLYNTTGRQVNNWTAVCNAGVVGAALYLEKDPARLAEMVARAARSLDDYLSTFDRDGGSTEGPGYWSYGFGFYTILAQLVEHRTHGQIRFMDESVVRQAAQFPLRTVLGEGVYVNFSDCDRNVHFIAAHLDYLSRRLDLPELTRLARVQPREGRRLNELPWALRDLCWRPAAEPAGDFIPAPTDWFPQMMWLLARREPADPNGLVLAAKGGHNEEMHNQNDVGNFIVHVQGETLIPDIGRGRYTKAYFGPTRYQHFVNSSRGHSVPRPNGTAQLPGADYAAVLLEQHSNALEDGMTLELKGAYPAEAGLESLRRTLALHRDTQRGWVELVDEVIYAGGPAPFESVLTTFSAVSVETGAVLIRGERGALRVSFDAAQVAARVEAEPQVDLGLGPQDVNCVIFSFLTERKAGTLRLRLEPVGL